jgi:general secretion pathway protein G
MRKASGGFTLLELITVMFIISILAGIALPQFKGSVIAAKEAVLKENLFQLRDLIDQYYLDRGEYPASLEALVEEGYLRSLPKDPMTGLADWTTELAEPDQTDPGAPLGLYDVHSSSQGSGLNGVPYSEW